MGEQSIETPRLPSQHRGGPAFFLWTGLFPAYRLGWDAARSEATGRMMKSDDDGRIGASHV